MTLSQLSGSVVKHFMRALAGYLIVPVKQKLVSIVGTAMAKARRNLKSGRIDARFSRSARKPPKKA